jgi:hypothetical protein
LGPTIGIRAGAYPSQNLSLIDTNNWYQGL